MRLGILLALISTFVFITVIGGPASATVSRPGYWLEAGDGGVFAYGAPFEASAAWDATRCPADPPARSMPDESCWSMASTSDVDGYWILNSYSGVIYTYGDAVSYGQPGDTPPYLGGADTWPDAIGIVAAPSGRGYWVLELGLSGLGSVQRFADAVNYGDETTGAHGMGHVGRPVAMAAHPTARGTGSSIPTVESSASVTPSSTGRWAATHSTRLWSE